ncbi:MAG TPA: carbohydrate binding domain-containing protein, partial [Victivallales bacterium]|nr:carbohydrate binding domain-containing protein [Victivallales bacterium]
ILFLCLMTFRTTAQLILKDDFEANFVPIPEKNNSWHQGAKIDGQCSSFWNDNSSWADVEVSYFEDRTDPHSGEKSQRIEVKRVNSGLVQFIFPFIPQKGKIYRAKLYLKGDSSSLISFGFRQLGTPYTVYGIETVNLTPEWREFSIETEIPSDERAIFILWLNAPKKVWIDDVSIEMIEKLSLPPQEGNILSNSSFEAGFPENWVFKIEGSDTIKLIDPRPVIVRDAKIGLQSLQLKISQQASAYIRSNSIFLTKGQSYSVSFWARANKNVKINAELVDTNMRTSFDVQEEWKRFEFSGICNKYKKITWLQINMPKKNFDYELFLDGIMLEATTHASENFYQNFPYEFVLQCNKPGNIFFDKDKTCLDFLISPDFDKEKNKISINIEDLFKKHSFSGTVNYNELSEFFSKIDFLQKRGMFKIKALLVSSDGKRLSDEQQVTIARLPYPIELGNTKESYFGIHVPLVKEYLKIAKLTGHKWIRLHDSSMIAKWNSLEPEENVFKFYDENIEAAKEEGFMILGMLDGAPPWMGEKKRGGYWDFWTIPTRSDWQKKWRNYCDTAISHYKGKIDDWEIWNEPWGEWFIGAGGQPSMYVEFMKEAKESTTKNNPDALIIGVDTYMGQEKWTESVLKIGGTDKFDIFSYHDYTDSLVGGKESRPKLQAEYFRKIQSQFGEVKPLWCTEGGVFDLGSFLKPDSGGLPYNMQPAYIVRLDTCIRAAGVKKFFYYAIHLDPAEGENSCRATEVGRAIKPLLAARAIYAYLTDGAVFKERFEDDELEYYIFDNPQTKTRITVCWSISGKEIKLKSKQDETVLDIWGNKIDSSNEVLINETPVYIVKKIL